MKGAACFLGNAERIKRMQAEGGTKFLVFPVFTAGKGVVSEKKSVVFIRNDRESPRCLPKWRKRPLRQLLLKGRPKRKERKS